MSDVATLMTELEAAARDVDAASNRLVEVDRQFNGVIDAESGEWREGIKTRYETALSERADEIYRQYENDGKRPPSAEIRETRAAKAIKESEPGLWASYHALEAEIGRLQRRIADRKSAISARQSVLSAERALMGPVGDPSAGANR